MRFVAAFAVICLLFPAAHVMSMDAGGVDQSSRSSSSGIGGGSVSSSRSSTTVEVAPSSLDPRFLRDDASEEGTQAGGLCKQAGKKIEESYTSGPSGSKQASHYFLSRWYDLCDIVDFSVGGGPGFLINAHVTKLAQFGVGYSDAYHVGFRGRSAGFWRERRTEAGVSLLYYQKVRRERITGWVESFRADKMDLDTSAVYANTNDRAFTGIGGMVHVLVMVDVNVRPIQALDFALGWFTIDILDDDTGHPHRNKDL